MSWLWCVISYMWHVLTWHDDLSWSYVKLSCFSIFLWKDMLWFELVCSGVISDNVICKDLSWYDVTATGDFASRMTEDLNKMQDGMGEKVIIQHISLQRLSNHTLKVGMLFRFIATGIGGFVYPFTQVEKQRWQSVELFLRTGFSPSSFSLWCQQWQWWAESLERSWQLQPRMRWTSMERWPEHCSDSSLVQRAPIKHMRQDVYCKIAITIINGARLELLQRRSWPQSEPLWLLAGKKRRCCQWKSPKILSSS